jgi:hypothetical protein
MTFDERRFISGLIRYYEPRDLLEIGVHGGAGTINLINAILDMNSKLVSVDKLKDILFEGDPIRIGGAAMDAYPNVLNDRWQLITGKDPSEVMEELDRKFDFVVIDTAHIHPVESMNFLSVLPWLNDDAIVVMHDTTNYINVDYHYAPRLLMSCVCAEKIEPPCSSFTGFPNIVAFQVTQDTRRYIQNVFDILMMPWGIFPKDDVENVHKLIMKYYTKKHLATFEMAVTLNRGGPIVEWNKLTHDTVFYGGGRKMRDLLDRVNKFGLRFDFTIWDINAEKMGDIDGHILTVPDFKSHARPKQKLVVMIENIFIFRRVRNQFIALGYEIYQGVSLNDSGA